MTAVNDKATGAAWRNPLRDKRMPRIAGPCGVVIFGVTGDLSRKKLMPAIYDLANRGLPASFALIGFARRDWATEDFGKVVYDAVKQHARTPFRQEVWDRLAEGIRFVQGTFDDDPAFGRLSETLEKLDALPVLLRAAPRLVAQLRPGPGNKGLRRTLSRRSSCSRSLTRVEPRPVSCRNRLPGHNLPADQRPRNKPAVADRLTVSRMPRIRRERHPRGCFRVSQDAADQAV
jgi:Glucose-6-phosphate dehydrogenase, NAD binding domain